jgi:hypothetical protein
MKRPLERFVIAAAVEACTTLAAYHVMGNDAPDQDDATSPGSNTAAVPGNPAADGNG